MAVVVDGITVPLSGNDEQIKIAAAKKLGVRPGDIAQVRVKRRSVDSRRREIRLVYTLHVTLHDKQRQQALEASLGSDAAHEGPPIQYGDRDPGRVVVIGAGPCGLFAAWALARHGYRPLLIERGCDIAQREADVARLAGDGVLNEESNVCFGAGGAGAFSDGKLTTRIKDRLAEDVLETLAACGALEQIMVMARPHMGTEHIRAAVSEMIGRIRHMGGEVRFQSRLTGLRVTGGALSGVTYEKDGLAHAEETRAAVLAIGHSARDTYEALLTGGVVMVPKPFAIGVRIEHPRELIDRAQYGNALDDPRLGAAEYRLAAKAGGRGVYTFCMCPGGQVICSATEAGGVAVNGMSYYARDGENSNSAVVVTVGPGDLAAGPLGGVAFQRVLERAAYAKAGGFGAPVQMLGDFAAGRASQRMGQVKPTYRPYTVCANLHDCLPGFVADALQAGIRDFGKKLRGFDMPEAVLTAVETRTSSPVRIVRQKDFQAMGIAGLYPAGEGAGYAGGIVSAAVDGIKCAQALMRDCKRPV